MGRMMILGSGRATSELESSQPRLPRLILPAIERGMPCNKSSPLSIGTIFPSGEVLRCL